ncbi:glyoxalase [Planomonospora parontospora subsp. parontospora]|uniref:Glyoxalase n=2 Tax=Planomonospora parontospora TaxID=58119 RepID=A0AA37F377_9ACTN|nr:VOC family protein [Planomonospora parontospora]GGK54345.1 glyoxalase [Planomonospora parontospora]GII07524.1 glyoxalase [Planomonospora parontospora subsp. parontospora]
MAESAVEAEIPDRYRYAVIPHIMVDDAAAAIDFYRRAFGAREDFRIDAPGGGILHAEISIGRSVLMLGDGSVDEAEAGSFAAPSSLGGGTSVTLHVFVPDVDGLAERAQAAGAEILQPPKDMFHGDRTVILKDPSGHIWVFLTHIEDVSEEELRRRLAAG